ncbi:MAG: carbohydrate ABC transporter permease [Defluviitaleaceae bacterium]|nr:carbohydrate ABC transporter permease [Defluviitaleaceae bacterium]MCL2275325.1 carbohydrate ABC transporter permease [Defluviitaleaceae bacterium]
MSTKAVIGRVVIYLILAMGALIMLVPFVWMLSTSLQTAHQVNIRPPIWIPIPAQWGNYSRILDFAPHFPRSFVNNLVVASIGTILELTTAILAAFAFSRLRFWGRDILFYILLATMMVPGEIMLIPNFLTIVRFEWLDTYRALIMPWAASILSIFLLRQFFLAIPEQLSYAAKVDGCRDFRFLWSIMVPLARPALVTIALLAVISSWNAFMWPLIVTNSPSMRTLPLALALFRGEAGTFFELLMAASVVVVLPMIILFIFMQKHIVAGVSRSGLKG